ncbi:MAG: hypothetical protein EBZ77_12955, partial [Chitinophagia bacterium]|nr:hypothetical protein [Chitinophagia bacterium]
MFLGNSAGRSLTNGLRNAFVGVNAGYSSNGNDNTYIGSNAGYFNTTGLNNTYIGRNAGYGVSGSTTGSNNTYLGTFAGNASTTGSGNLVAGYNAQTGASAGNTTVIGSTANGSASSTVAIGFGAVASGLGSTAIGNKASATADNALVLGSINGVNGATASVNVGIGTTAPASKLHVVGQTQVDGQIKITGGTPGNGKVLTSDATGLASWTSPAASGGSLDQAYDFGGNGAGRVITADAGAVRVEGTDGFLVTGIYGSGAAVVSNPGVPNMFFNPSKAAFRAGFVMNQNWDADSLGIFSFGTGYGTKAKGSYSTAIGFNTTASQEYSTAMGFNTVASGDLSTAMGRVTTASGQTSTAMGWNTVAVELLPLAVVF